jgi:hypothetical protein
MTQTSHDDDALDLLHGAEAIAVFLNLKKKNGEPDTRRAYHLLESEYIPATKFGALWVASKRKLRAKAHGEAA